MEAMIVEYIRYEVDEPDALVAAYARAARSLDASPHCLGYELARCVEDPKTFILRIEWDSASGHLEGFRKSAEFREFFAAIRGFVNAIKEMRHYEVTAVSRP